MRVMPHGGTRRECDPTSDGFVVLKPAVAGGNRSFSSANHRHGFWYPRERRRSALAQLGSIRVGELTSSVIDAAFDITRSLTAVDARLGFDV